MQFIQHIIEPKKLLLIWQSSDESYRTRHIVGELYQIENEVKLSYLSGTSDFQEAKKHGFESYVAFPDISKTYFNVLDTFMRRLPPRSREDFGEYLKNFRIPPHASFTDFALLGYTGAKLPSDNFSIIHPFENVEGACELLIEATGFRHILKENSNLNIQINDFANFKEEKDESSQELKLAITVKNQLIGYVSRPLIATFVSWIKQKRIISASIEKKNGQPGKPTIYLYIKVSALNQ